MKVERGASADEAAAIAAAVERFVSETTVGTAGPEPRMPPWQRAALLEGVSAKQAIQDPEGGVRWQ
jgi:hypothetical protein